MNISYIILPLVAISLFGFITAKRLWLTREQLAGISKFIFNFVIPVFLFEKMATAEISGQFDIRYFLSFYAPLVVVYIMALTANYFFHSQYRKQVAASSVFALGATYSNTVIVALPVLLAAIGAEVVSIVFLIITFHSALLFTVTSILCLKDNKQGDSVSLAHRIGQQTLYNPIVLSISLGLLSHFLPIQIPEIALSTLALFGQPAIPCALFLLGTSLAFYRVRDEKFFIAFASALKLLIFPVVVWLTTQFIFDIPDKISVILVIMSASPTGVNAYLIAKLQNVHDDTIAGTVVVSTLMSIITIPMWLAFLGM